jgi:hypothetical protein
MPIQLDLIGIDSNLDWPCELRLLYLEVLIPKKFKPSHRKHLRRMFYGVPVEADLNSDSLR